MENIISRISEFLSQHGIGSLADALGAIIATAIIAMAVGFWKIIPHKLRFPTIAVVSIIVGGIVWASIPPQGYVTVLIASSSTKQHWMEAAAVRFNSAKNRIKSGRKIKVVVEHVNSGDSKDQILNNFRQSASDHSSDKNVIKPLVWSPGTLSWVDQLRSDPKGQKLITNSCVKTVYSPIGIAMWEPMARGMGWPDKSIGFQEVIGLAANPSGWQRYNKPWGKFKFAHPNPQYSNAGLLFMVALAHAAIGEPPTDSTIYGPEVRKAFRTLELNTFRYDSVSTNLLQIMSREGVGYLHAISAFEEGVARANKEQLAASEDRLVFIFPSEGTFWSGHPYCVLDQAPWLEKPSEQIEAAELFREFLLSQAVQETAAIHFLRPINPKHYPAQHPLTADPRLLGRSALPLAIPSNGVSEAAIELFWLTKRKISVVVVLDRSASMGSLAIGKKSKMDLAKEATEKFIGELKPLDRVKVVTFNEGVSVVKDMKEKQYHWPEGKAIDIDPVNDQLIPWGNTALYDAVCKSAKDIKQTQQSDIKRGDNRIYALILMSDGKNTQASAEGATQRQMFAACIPNQAEIDGVRVNTIAFGSEADEALLKKIARNTGGSVCKADPPYLLERCYRDINKQ